jgi:hypothetical protein
MRALAPRVTDCKREIGELRLELTGDDNVDNPDGRGVPTLPTLTDEELDEVDVKKVKHDMEKMEAVIQKEKPNLTVLQEYNAKVRYNGSFGGLRLRFV